MHPCTFPGIFLGPTGNCQGTHKVFDMNTGVVKKTHTITPLPMPDKVIKSLKIGADATRRKTRQNPSNFSIENGSNTTGRTMILKTMRALSNWILPILTFPPNFLVSILNQNNPTTTKLSKLSKTARTNVYMLHNGMHPSTTSTTRMQECLLPLKKSTHSSFLKTAPTHFTS